MWLVPWTAGALWGGWRTVHEGGVKILLITIVVFGFAIHRWRQYLIVRRENRDLGPLPDRPELVDARKRYRKAVRIAWWAFGSFSVSIAAGYATYVLSGPLWLKELFDWLTGVAAVAVMVAGAIVGWRSSALVGSPPV